MPYKLEGNCVKKKTGETVKCHDSHEKALAHMRALEINVGHKEKQSVLVTTKEASGKLRWVVLASGAYGPDREGEWITEKALKTWADGFAIKGEESVPLRNNGETVVARWWHVGKPDRFTLTKGPGLDLGECDLAVYTGKSLVMSGTFYDEEIGLAIAEKADKLGVSVSFFHPLSEPINGEYSQVDIFEVSFLPVERSAYPFTGLSIAKGS